MTTRDILLLIVASVLCLSVMFVGTIADGMLALAVNFVIVVVGMRE